MTNPLYNTIYAEIKDNQSRVKDILSSLDYLKRLVQQARKEEDEEINLKYQRFYSAIQDVINNPKAYA